MSPTLGRVACAALALLVTGCALIRDREEEVVRPAQSPIVEQWTGAIRDMGKFPVYPPTEDVYVGDVFAFSSPPDGSAALDILRATANPRWGSLQVLARLDSEYRERPAWNRSGEDRGDESLFQGDRPPLRHRTVDLQLRATASLDLPDLAPFLPVEIAPLVGGAESDRYSVGLNSGAAESYALSVDHLMEQLLDPPAEGERTRARLKPEQRLTLPLATDTASGKVYVGVVSEVLYLRSLDATLRRRGEPRRSREGRADETAAAMRRAAELNAALQGSDIEQGIADSIEFVSATDDVLGLRRTWKNPPAVAVRGLMLEVDVASGEVLRSAPLGLELPELEREQKKTRTADESAVLEERRRGTEADEEQRTGIYWDVGPRFTGRDGELNLFLGGRLHLDVATFAEDDDINAAFGEPDEGMDVRRAFLELGGVYKQFDFNFWVNFSDAINDRSIEEVDYRNVFVGMHGIPYVGNVRVGYFKEPFGLEEITSSNDITFLERSLTDAFIERRNLGIMFERRFAKERRGTASLGFYKDADNDLDTGTGVGVTARVTGAPVLSEDERSVLHIGTSATYRDPGSDGVRFFQRPESSQAQILADTGTLDADSDLRVGLELAGTLGSLSLQTETIFAHLDGEAGVGSPTFWSAYVMGSYILTGEHRSYRERVGAYGTVLPERPLTENGGGAWELATRYSYLDLDSAGVSGGVLHDWTLGLNWYAGLNMRMMFNYILAHPEGFDYEHILQARLQLTF